ncbi:ribosomal protein L20 [Skeletonema marinoi]|uniref:Large ribosomal subunit protein bL20c n=1 Tax=Skeletonema marinoi TaxID=267567 RepID=A0AAD8YFM3_9STRA|nr:ribosomal protein L20 [Skeletonema marinoi]
MLSQMSRRLVPVLGRAAKADTLPRLFSGLNITMRNNTSNLTAARSIGSMASLPSAAPIRSGTTMNSLMTRSVFANTNFATNNSIMLGTSSVTSQHQARGFASKKHKRVIKLSKGFRGRANRCFRVAIRRLEKSWQYAYRDRKVKKREFRKLWIQRLNAGVRQQGLSYSRFIQMEGKSGVKLDRKILSGLAMYEPFSFKAVVDVVKKMSAEGN